MKLRNKKTGEIGSLVFHGCEDKRLWVWIDKKSIPEYRYSSLAELNEEWEDAPEEPKRFWSINGDATIEHFDRLNENDHCKQIGNYFSSREEAEKAVEKLKAWKLLKDECDIKFDGIIRGDNGMLKAVKLSYDRHEVTFERMRECMDALHLIFGGEE